jgi:glycosyltransferase involved in cell wall biosynthesis
MISIIIPTYNEEAVIGDTIKHLKTLTITHEVIITDDKSDDRTVEIAKKFADVVHETEVKHTTISANRNRGARDARGDFLVFMDSTSFIPENLDDFFVRARAHFDADPKLMALTGALWVLPEMETAMDRIVYVVFNWVHRLKNNVLHTGESSGKFQMMRKSAFNAVGGFNINLVTREDADMFNRLGKLGRTICDPKLVIYHSGRRAHAIGWPRLLYTWMIESLWVALFGKALSTNWDRYWERKTKIQS